MACDAYSASAKYQIVLFCELVIGSTPLCVCVCVCVCVCARSLGLVVGECRIAIDRERIAAMLLSLSLIQEWNAPVFFSVVVFSFHSLSTTNDLSRVPARSFSSAL